MRFPANQGVVCAPQAEPTGGQTGRPITFSQGISGSIRIGPVKPVSIPGQPNTKPYAARISIYRLDGTRATRVASDASDVFSVGLPAGAYIVRPGAHSPIFPRAKLFSITIQKGQWRCVTIVYDSGIR